MKRRTMLLASSAFFAAAGPLRGRAQDAPPAQATVQPFQEPSAVECPPDARCVLYAGVTIAIDPAQGPYQVIVVEEQEIRANTLAGTEIRQAVVGAGFLRRQDGSYAFDQTYTKAKAGPFADAQLEDVYVLGPAV